MATHRLISLLGLPLFAGAMLLAGRCQPVLAQWVGGLPSSQFELADAVDVDRVDHTVQLRLDKAKALLADRQWDEAVEILRQLAEAPDGKLVGIAPQRYIGLQDWCQRQLVHLPPEARELYRARVDPVAAQWYRQGIAARNRTLLQNVVDRAVASSYGDRALMALGEIALESGDYAAAHSYWERIIPSAEPCGVSVPGPASGDHQSSITNDQSMAPIRARLVLVSILAGENARARAELASLRRLHPDARGQLGGREGKYVELLESLLAESISWPAAAPDPNWTTFAGNPQRNKIAPALADVNAVLWRMPLISRSRLADGRAGSAVPHSPSIHPLLVGDLVLVNDAEQIIALRWRTGEPAWGQSATIYRSELVGATNPSARFSYALGTPQYTMTACHNRLYARMGFAPTGQLEDGTGNVASGSIVCLDLASEGRLLWKITPEEGWALEGSPLADDGNVYMAMRRRDVRPQAAVACFDAGTGRLRWRRLVCAAETPGRGMLPECTHNLLALSGGTLYCNTNLGAVAALRAEDGRILWVTLYPRALRGDLAKLAPHWRRALNPCLVHRGMLFVAPADSPRIFAFDAAAGEMIWQTGTDTEDAVDLLGATDDWLIAGGGRLFWISLQEKDHGRLKRVWPEGSAGPGYGRGLLSGDCVLWPTRDKLYAFDLRTAQQRKVFDLAARNVTGGNLLVAGRQLLVATDNELIMIGASGTGASHEQASNTTDSVP